MPSRHPPLYCAMLSDRLLWEAKGQVPKVQFLDPKVRVRPAGSCLSRLRTSPASDVRDRVQSDCPLEADVGAVFPTRHATVLRHSGSMTQPDFSATAEWERGGFLGDTAARTFAGGPSRVSGSCGVRASTIGSAGREILAQRWTRRIDAWAEPSSRSLALCLGGVLRAL